MDLSGHGRRLLTVGSLEGDGLVFLGARALAVGSNSVSTIFSGVIQDGGSSGGTGGSLTKIGPGTLQLSGAQFNFVPVANKRLTPGTVFTAISNTAATPIAGAFANLPDGSTFTVGRNTYQVSYSGGDGNDLTLTVVP